MKGIRIASAGGLVGLAGLICAPVSAHADVVSAPNGVAKAAALKVTISPQALVDINGLTHGLLSSLPSDQLGLVDTLKGVLTSTSTIALDDSEVNGTLNAAATDLTAAHSLSSALLVNVAGLDKVLTNLQNLLNALGVGDATSITNALGALNTLPANLASQLGPVTGVVNSLNGITAPLTSLLGNLSPNLALNRTLVADLLQGPPKVSSDVINLSNQGLLGSLQLAPFEATAVNNAQAAANGASSAIAEAHNSTTALSIGQGLPALGVVNAATLNNAIDAVGQVLKNLVNLTPLSGNANLTDTVNSVVNALPGTPLGSAGTALNGVIGQIQNALPAALGSQVGSLGSGTLSGTIDNALGTLKGLINTLTGVGALNSLLGSIDLNGIISTNGVTSSAITQPLNGGVHTMASTSFVDVQVLKILSGQIASLLSSTPLGHAVPVGTPLLEIKGISSSVDAFVNGVNNDLPSGTTKLAEVDVLGTPVVSTDTVLNPGQSITIPVNLGPVGQLTAIITRGAPQVISNTPTMKSVSASALSVKLLNGDINGQSPLTILGAAGAGSIVDVGVAQTMAAASMSQPLPVSTPNVPVAPSPLPETGMVGPLGLVAGFGLGLVGLGMNAISRRRQIG